MANLMIFLALSIGFYSCASKKVQNSSSAPEEEKHLSQKEIQELNKKTLAKVSERLEELSIAAKASGPDKVKFLASDFYLKASAALMEGDYLTANMIFEHLVKLVPEDMFIKKKYAISLIRTGQLEESKKLLEVVHNSSPHSDENISLVLGGLYSSLGEVKKSQKIYQELLATNPKNEEACVFLGKSYVLEKKITKGVELLNKCQSRSPKRGIYSYYIGKVYSNKKQYNKAQKYFQEAIKREPTLSEAVLALGLIYEDKAQSKKAENLYKKHLKKNNDSAEILARLVELLFTQEKFKEVIEYAEVLSDLDPSDLNLRVKLGILYTDTKQYGKAVETFKSLLLFSPDNDKLLYYLGAIHQETKSFEEALEAYSRIPVKSALYQDSSLQMAHILSAMALSERENQPRFLSYVDSKIKELGQFKFEFSMVKASFLETTGDVPFAIKTLETIVDEKSFSKDHKFYLASLYEKEKKFSQSESLVKGILKDDPENAHALNFLGYSLLERNEQFDLAYKYISKAIEIMPKDGYIRDSLGWYFYKIGDVKRALKELKSAAKTVPTDISINKHLAVVYSTLKNFSKAQVYIKKAIAEVQSEDEKKELQKILKELEKSRLPASFK